MTVGELIDFLGHFPGSAELKINGREEFTWVWEPAPCGGHVSPLDTPELKPSRATLTLDTSGL